MGSGNRTNKPCRRTKDNLKGIHSSIKGYNIYWMQSLLVTIELSPSIKAANGSIIIEKHTHKPLKIRKEIVKRVTTGTFWQLINFGSCIAA